MISLNLHSLPAEKPVEYINNLALSNPKLAGEMAMQLFCTPMAGHEYSKREELLMANSLMKRYTVKDFEVQTYRWVGEGKRVLLMHGWDDNSMRWRPLISLLKSEDFDVLALDAPAHGKSGNEFAHGILYAECLNKVAEDYKPDIIIAHSFGGLAASYNYGKLANQEIEKMILLAAPSELETSFNTFYKGFGISQETQKAVAEMFVCMFEFEINCFASSDFVKNVSAKGLVIHDELDPVVPISEAYDIHRNWSGSELLVTQNLGHSLHAPSVFHKIMEFCS